MTKASKEPCATITPPDKPQGKLTTRALLAKEILGFSRGIRKLPAQTDAMNIAALIRDLEFALAEIPCIDLYSAGAPRCHFALNLWTVALLKVCPGRSTTVGKVGLLIESGKCCVSRQNAPCCPYFTPPTPVVLPSR